MRICLVEIEDEALILLYSIDPNIMEHMRIAKIRPKGRSGVTYVRHCGRFRT